MFRQLLLGAVVALLVSCGPAYIEGTSVPDSDENRELVNIVEQYRQAIERRDVTTLAQLVSKDYFENASTTSNTEDDYGYEKLIQKVLPVLADNIKQVVYKIKIDKVSVEGNKARVFFEWEITFQYEEGGLKGWSTKKDRNRMDFAREGGRWKITAGL